MSFCDLTTGICEPAAENEMQTIRIQKERIKVLYVTDPICSACWAMEPAWRKFLFHYGDSVDVRHIYGGLLPGWNGFSDAGAGIGAPADVAPHWAEVAEQSGQPINPDVWLTDPLDSSYPPSKAVHVVRLMAPEQEENYLRRIRQALFLEARNIARADVLTACAADIGLDAGQFTALYTANVGAAGFQRDLEETRQLPVRGFPTLIFIHPDGDNASMLRGTQPFVNLERAFLEATSTQKSEKQPTPEAALISYGTGTTREFAELLNLNSEDTEQALIKTGADQISLAGLAGSHLWRSAVPVTE